MIEVKSLNKIYRMGKLEVIALKDISLTVEPGEFVAIMGPSGSGKSTLTQILGLLDVPSSGSYQLYHKEVSNLSEDELSVLRRDEIGFIFQQFHLLPRMTAAENVSLPLFYSRTLDPISRGNELLEQVGLADRGDHKPNELSGGQQQRVAIARSLVNAPQIIIADEPTGNLDSQSEKEIMGILKRLNSQGITIIMVTHEEEIGLQANRLIRMRDGVIQSDERSLHATEHFLAPKQVDLLKNETANNMAKNMAKISLLSEIIEHLRQGGKTLVGNKVRTALSVLGIMIGVAAVVAMLAIGKGAQNAIEKELSSLGSNLLVLRAGAARAGGVALESGATSRLTVEDAKMIKDRFQDVQAVSPSVSGRAQVTFLNKNWSTSVSGVSAGYAQIRALVPDVGRFFTVEEEHTRSRVAVLGRTVVRALFDSKNPIGEIIKINKINFTVIGVQPEKGANGWRDQDDIIMIPLGTAMHRLLGKNYVDSIDIEINKEENVDQVQDSIVQLMITKHRVPPALQEGAFTVRNNADIKKALAQSSETMALLLSSIAAISLLVGGIGIMNIMLVSVTERTKEIGLRKAIGARKKDILLQFLAESIVVSLVGGVAGVVLGILITLILGSLAGWATSISIESVVVAFFFSASIGMIFGIYPAKKASQLHPIQALRFE